MRRQKEHNKNFILMTAGAPIRRTTNRASEQVLAMLSAQT